MSAGSGAGPGGAAPGSAAWPAVSFEELMGTVEFRVGEVRSVVKITVLEITVLVRVPVRI